MRVNEPLQVRSRFRAPWMIFWVGFGLRVAAVLIGHTYRIRPLMDHFGFGWEMGRIARSVATGHGYGNPFNGPSGPTAWCPPLYPLLIALAFKLFGVYTNAAAIFLMVADSVFSAAIAPAVYEIAARCFDARGLARRRGVFFGRATEQPVALWSAWLWAVYPAALQYAVHWIWEMSLSACLFAWIVVLALRMRGTGEAAGSAGPRWVRLGAVFGLLWGLLALSNSSLLLCLPAMLVWAAWPQLVAGWRLRRLPWAPLAGAAATTLCFALVLTPWVVRNERVLGAPVLTRSNFGVELWNSTLESHDAFPWGTTLPLWAGDPEFHRFVQMGELRYAAMLGQEARARIEARPDRFLRWTLDRFLFFWDGTPHALENHAAQEYLRQTSYAFLSLCGLLGLALMLRRRVEGAGLFLVAFLLVPLPYYLVTVQARFRHPIEPLIAVLGVFLFRCAERKTGIRD